MSIKVQNIRSQDSSQELAAKRTEPDLLHLEEEDDDIPYDDVDVGEMWNPYLYSLQQKAPRPRPVPCKRPVVDRPTHYGSEFHGGLSRADASELLEHSGSYLVRTSHTSPGDYSLSLNFEGQVKHFKLYYDVENGLHYVGEKRFDTMHDLVKDGLITYYVEAHAQSYIDQLPEEGRRYETIKKRRRPSRPSVVESVQSEADDDRAYHEVGVVFRKAKKESRKVKSVDSPRAAPLHPRLRMHVPVVVDNPMMYEKSHVFKVTTFHGPNWCDFCRNFMWGWRQQGVRCSDCGYQCHKGCSAHTMKDCQPDRKRVKRLFGADLTTVTKAYGTRQPVVLEKCIAEIESRGLDAEGLYRVPGFADDVVSIKNTFDKDGLAVNLSSDRYPDINTVAGVLKQYLRELPIPLIPFESYQAFIDSMRLDTNASQVYALKSALSRLSKPHFNSLRYLIDHLERVAQHCDKNLMTSDNLGVVFGPTVMRPGNPITAHGAALIEVPLQKKAVSFMIDYKHFLFGD